MRAELILLCFGMMAVTYLPRALPAALVDKLKFSPRVEKFLKLIHYTAMAALVIPGAFNVDAARPEIGMIGILVAGLLAWRKLPMMVCVIGAIVADFLLYLL